MRKQPLSLVALTVLATASACAGNSLETGNGGNKTDNSTAKRTGEWSYPSDSRSAGSSTTPSDGQGGAAPQTGASSSGSFSSSGSNITVDCHWGTSTIQLTLPNARYLASAAIARGVTNSYGRLPEPTSLSAHDFLNYYPIRYPAPPSDVPAVYAGLAPIEGTTGLVLQTAVQAPALTARPTLSLAVVVDSSVSMSGGAMRRAREALMALLEGLWPGDSLLVTTSLRGGKSVVIDSQDALDRALLDASKLDVDGGDDLGGALNDAYAAVGSAIATSGGVGRVVLITDGAAEPTSIDLAVVAGNLQQLQIPLVGVGVGDAIQYDHEFIKVASSVGGGASIFIDDTQGEAERVLHGRFDELMFDFVSDLEITVTLPDALRMQAVEPEAQTGSASGLAAVRIGPGRALVVRQNLETCASSLDLINAAPISITAKWKRSPTDGLVPIEGDAGGRVDALLASMTTQTAKGSAIAAYGEAVAGLRPALFQFASKLTKTALALDKNDPELLEVDDLITKDLAILSKGP